MLYLRPIAHGRVCHSCDSCSRPLPKGDPKTEQKEVDPGRTAWSIYFCPSHSPRQRRGIGRI